MYNFKMKIHNVIVIFLVEIFVFVVAFEPSSDQNVGLSSNSYTPHSRKKRYLVFPKGASLQILLEVLSHVDTQFKLFVGPTLQIAWPLPYRPFEELSRKPAIQHRISEEDFSSNLISSSSSSSSYSTRNKRKTERHKLLNNLAAGMSLFGTTVGLAWQLPDDPKIYEDLKKKHKVYKRSALTKVEAFMRPNGANGQHCVLRALCESGQRTPSKKNFATEILHKIFSYTEDEDHEENHTDKLYRKAHQSINQDCVSLYPECQFSIFEAVQ